MRAMHLCLAFALAGCMVAIGAASELGPDAALALGEGLGVSDSPPPQTNKDKQAFNEKMKAVAELHEEAADVKDETIQERSNKAVTTAEFNSVYKQKKQKLIKKQNELEVKIATDRNLVESSAQGDEQAAELRKKHDKRIKSTMKVALNAMRKVEHVTNNQVSNDPIVRAADKAVMKQRGDEIYSVLGLDDKQLNQHWLVKMDQTVANYNEMPDSHNLEKMEKQIVVTKERVRKEKIIEMKAKRERAAKDKRSADNAAYYATKWNEKKKELGRKKEARDTYVKKLQAENKFKKWVQEQNENESGHKRTIYENEKGKKETIERAHKVQREKVYAANANIVAQTKKKFEFEQSQLQAKLDAAAGDYSSKKNELVTAKEVRQKARASMHTVRANSERAVELETAQAAKSKAADEQRAQFASQTNFAAAQLEQEKLEAAKKSTAEAQFKYKASITTMDEKDKIQSQKENAEAEALKNKQEAENKVADHKAKRQLVLEQASKPPSEIEDQSPPADMDPMRIMRKQQAARQKMLSPAQATPYPKPRVDLAGKEVEAGAGVPDPAGKKDPLNAPPGFQPDPRKGRL